MQILQTQVIAEGSEANRRNFLSEESNFKAIHRQDQIDN